MKRLQIVLCFLLSTFFTESRAQEVCGFLSPNGKYLVIYVEGKTDTFYKDVPYPVFGGGGSSGTGTSTTGATASISYEDSIRIITQYKTIYRYEEGEVVPPENLTTMSAEEIKNLIKAAEEADKLEKKLAKEKLKRDKEYAKREKKVAKKQVKREKKALKKEAKNDSNSFHLNISLRPIGRGLAIAGGAIGVGLGAAVGAVGIAAVGVGVGVVETGKFLARPFKKCDCDGDVAAEPKKDKGDDDKADENPSPEGKVIHRHGRRVKESKKPKKKRVKGKKGPKCGTVSG